MIPPPRSERSVEKRLPLFLLLSFLVLVIWTIVFPPPERPRETSDPMGVTETSSSGTEGDSTPSV